MLCQYLKQLANRWAIRSESQEIRSRLLSGRRANVGLFLRVEVRGKYKSVFDIVDAKLGGLAVRDRTEMPRDFEAALVRSINHSPKLTRGNMHERFEGSDTLIGPEFHCLASVLRTAEFVDGQTKIAFSLQVRPRHVDFRAWNLASVYPVLQV